MRKSLTWIAFCAVVSAFVAGPEAHARPDYLKAFNAAYPALKAEAEAAKCGICHPEEKKAVRNDYGKAYGTAVGEKNVKFADNEKKLTEAPAEKTTHMVALPRGSGFLFCRLPDAFGNLDRPFFLDLVRCDVCRWTQVGCPTLSAVTHGLRNLSTITLDCQRMGKLVDPLRDHRFEPPSQFWPSQSWPSSPRRQSRSVYWPAPTIVRIVQRTANSQLFILAGGLYSW